MTVAQLIDRLKDYPPDALVWIPCAMDGKNGTVQFVVRMPHVQIPIPGVAISDDVALLPGEMDSFVLEDNASDEDRQGES